MARVRNGTADGKVFIVGDSTTAGAGANTLAASVPNRLAGLLDSYVCRAGLHSTLGRNNVTAVATDVFDPRVALGAGWTAGNNGAGGGYSAPTTATGNLSFTPTVPFDTITVYTAVNSGNGTSTVNVDGGASLGTMTTSGTQALGTHTFTCALGTHTINISPPTVGTIHVLGIEVADSTTRRMRVYNAGYAGQKAAFFTSASLAWNTYNWWPVVAPDLTILNLTINDSNQTGLGATDTATYSSQITSLITRAQATGDCLLMVGNPTNTEASLQTYRDILYGLADTHDCALLDLKDRWQSYAVSNPLGYYADTAHPSAVGYQDIASALLHVLQAA